MGFQIHMSYMVKRIFWANVIVFLFTGLLQILNIPIIDILALHPYDQPSFHYYQMITSLFVHGGILHILFNMLTFIFIGPYVEDYLGRNKFLIYYILCGIGGSLLWMLTSTSDMGAVGASGAIFGILAMFAFIYPNQKLMLFFIPIGIKAKYLIGTYILIELYLAIMPSPTDAVAHTAHLGGAIAGASLFLINKYLIKN